MGLTTEQYGYIAAAASMLAFGSFNIPLKLRSTQDAKPDPMVFQVYINIAVFISSWLVLTYNPFIPTYWGIVSGTLWVFSSILSVFAVNYSGLAVSQGIWAGCTIIVSFFWGSVIFHQELESLGLSLVGLVMLMVGIAGMSIAGSELLSKNNFKELSSVGLEDNSIISSNLEEQPNTNNRKKLIGYICAATLSLTNGSMLAPIHYAPPEAQGINFIVSFGIGVLSVTPLFSVIYYMILFQGTVPQWKPKILLLPGLAAGLGWNIGNFASIYATAYLGYTVGFPLSQCALLISGFWGIALFKEITGWKRILLFVVSSIVLFGGAVVLALYGRKQ
jgi:glucose uptake protein GlcU